jgi:siroheme synthase (precorrin-2 oxidase/ferrochelatase)
VLVNRADEPTEGDFTVPAHARHGPITLAVHTGGVSAGAGAAIRRELSAALDPAWPRLLELVAPFRSRIQDATPEPDVRQEKLQRLAGPETMKLLKEQGPEAVKRFCESLASPAAPATS